MVSIGRLNTGCFFRIAGWVGMVGSIVCAKDEIRGRLTYNKTVRFYDICVAFNMSTKT